MDEFFTALDPSKVLKTYTKADRSKIKPIEKYEMPVLQVETPLNTLKREPLTTKNALKLLIEGNLKSKVCRYCLNVSSELSELDQILQIADKETLYKVTIKDMVASFHPFKIADDPNFPDKICNKCIDRTLTSYLFTQQCERAERALRNCFEDMYEKLDKLDSVERPKKRGRQKANPNYNKLHAEHEKVIDYADPIIHIVNTESEQLTDQSPINELECLKCCELLPTLESLINHMKIHPKSMWYNCRLCGQSFVKLQHLKKHFRGHNKTPKTLEAVKSYDCKTCGVVTENYYKFLQHIEKHKFKMVMEHLVEGKMDNLCAVCMDNGKEMVGMDKMICLHGGCPELAGDKPIYKVLASTLPEMNILHNYTGTKICEKCLSHAITSYVFTNHTYFVRNRLNTCVSVMLENLDKMTDVDKNICIEIARTAIMNVEEQFDEESDDNKYIDESLNVEILEDEFRIESDDESDTETETQVVKKEVTNLKETYNEPFRNNVLVNGFKVENSICNEFLSLKKPSKPRLSCPLCKKHFISHYFLKRHILKHVPKNVECNICASQFPSKFYLYEHKKMFHIFNRSEYHECKICGRCYINENKLLNHSVRHRNQQCQLCQKKFRCQNRFNDHIQRHINKLGIIMRKYKQNCSFCEKYCSNDNELSLHVNKVHLQIKPYNCDMCERQFYTEYNLRCHEKLHSRRSKEQCEFCNKILHSRKNLVVHIRKHIGEMPFLCQLCNQSFYSQSKLGNHMKLYHGGRFCCKFCKTIFVTRKGLKEHVSKKHNSIF